MDPSPLKKPRTESSPLTLKTRKLGSSPLEVSQIGYGAWPLSYGNRPSEEDAIAVLHRALDFGVRFIDTADAYCLNEDEKHHNEKLIRKALKEYPIRSVAEKVVVATKGICIRPDGRWERRATTEQIVKAIAGSHLWLTGAEQPIDLWQIHWCNPQGSPDKEKPEPLQTLLKPVLDAVEKGTVRFVGLSNCTLAQVKLAQKILPPGKLVSVQNRLNMWDMSSALAGIVDYCQEQGLAFLPFSPLGGPENAGGKGLLRDEANFPKLNQVAKEKGCSPEALVLAYMSAKWNCIVHITSARSLKHLEDSLRSTELVVTAEEVALIDKDADQVGNNPAFIVPKEDESS